MTTNKNNLPPIQPPSPLSTTQLSTTDKLISFGLFFVWQMGIAFLIKALANKVFAWYHLPLIGYWECLSVWLLWLIFMVMPFMMVGFLLVQELASHATQLVLNTVATFVYLDTDKKIKDKQAQKEDEESDSTSSL